MRRLLLSLLGLGIIFFLWVKIESRPPDSSDSTQIIFSIEKGQHVSEIAQNLSDKHLIRSPLLFKLMARYKGVQGQIKAGQFTLHPDLSALQVLDTLVEGKQDEVSITIPEGFTIAQIDDLVASKGLGLPGDIISCSLNCSFPSYSFLPAAPGKNLPALEGYLFPDTYFVNPADYQPSSLLERMMATFKSRILDAHAGDIKSSGKSLEDIVTMASLIEEESRHDDERAIVAGILWKRLNARIALGVDASLRYALNKRNEPLTEEDLQSHSPYNTRKVLGLPPGPVANPSESSIVAAIHPIATEAWYYLHDSQGNIHYAKTNDEHNENRAKYLR